MNSVVLDRKPTESMCAGCMEPSRATYSLLAENTEQVRRWYMSLIGLSFYEWLLENLTVKYTGQYRERVVKVAVCAACEPRLKKLVDAIDAETAERKLSE